MDAESGRILYLQSFFSGKIINSANSNLLNYGSEMGSKHKKTTSFDLSDFFIHCESNGLSSPKLHKAFAMMTYNAPHWFCKAYLIFFDCCDIIFSGDIMFITFRNNSSDSSIKLNINNTSYLLEPGSDVEASIYDDFVSFSAEILPTDLASGWDEEETPKKLKDRIFFKLAKKFAEKIPELGLYSSCEYEISEITNGMTIELYDGGYSVLDGKISDYLFEMVPIIFTFARAEVISGKLKFKRAKLVNHKKFLKIVRNILLFIDTDLFLPNLIFFIPKYIVERFLATGIYLTIIMKWLYSMSVTDRVHKINAKLKDVDIRSKRSFLSAVIKTVLAILIIYGIGYLVVSSDPEPVESIGSYESYEFYTSGGFQDYTDYAKYVFDEVDFEDNEFFVPVSSVEKANLITYIDDFEDWINAVGDSNPENEVVREYDFNDSLISSDDYVYISFLYEDNPMGNYDVYFFDTGTMTLYYFHNNT